MLVNRKIAACVVLFLAQALWAADQKGTVAGLVMNSQTGRPIAGAKLEVDGQNTEATVTDSDGRFAIPLSPGTYRLRVSAPDHLPFTMTDVVVNAGATTDASTLLSHKSQVTSVEVVDKATAVGASAEALLQERRLSPVLSDSLGRDELSSSTASDAAGALQQVTGVSLVGGEFVFVRGLGERYSSTELNGAQIPTTDPEKRVVPLDLFPTGMIDNIKVLKTYTPDLPAEFSGGLVQLQTVEFPTERTLKVSVKSSFNTVTTGKPFLTYPGGSNDFWGYGSGDRGIPAAIPEESRVLPGAFSQQEIQTFGRAFSNNWQPTTIDSARPAVDWSATGGGTWGRLGIVGALTFGNKPQLQSETVRYYRQGLDAPVVFTDYTDFREHTETARLGAVFNAALRLTPTQKLVFRNTYTHDAEKSARQFEGYDAGVGGTIAVERLRYIERSLYSTGVEGEHSFASLKSSLFHWQFTYSRSSRDEPDLREVVRNRQEDGRYIFAGLSTSGIRFFSAMEDRIYEPQFDYSIPFFGSGFSGLFKTGVRATVRRRDFAARRFYYSLQNSSTVDLYAPSNELFAPENIRPDGFQLTEYTRSTDAYDATMNVYAGYAMVDLSLGTRWRLVGGLRVEDSEQIVTTRDNFSLSTTPVRAALQNRDPTPAINAIYALTARQNLRFSYSRTLSRPDFRELSPFDFADTLGGFIVAGNPDLKRAVVDNADARWEWFPGGNQLVAASFFVKRFTDPIEQIVVPSNDLRQSFVNAKGARNFGLELEFRRSLGTFSRKLREFSVSSNLTVVDSNIVLDPGDASILTSKSRPLLGQSRYVANAILAWRPSRWQGDASFTVNYVSRRIENVGTFGLPDIYEEGNTILNFSYQHTFDEKKKWSVRFEGENLGDNDYLWTQGGLLQRNYRSGRTFQVGLSYEVF